MVSSGMRLYRDTTPEAEAIQVAVWRRLGASRRLELALQISEQAREMTRSGIRSRHPDYSEREVEIALRCLLLGEELFRAAWPGEEPRSP